MYTYFLYIKPNTYNALVLFQVSAFCWGTHLSKVKETYKKVLFMTELHKPVHTFL